MLFKIGGYQLLFKLIYGCQHYAEEGVALLEKAAGQGHVYAMYMLGGHHGTRNEFEQAVKWATKGAEAGFPKAMLSLGCSLDEGRGVAAPDLLAAADWFRRAAEAGVGDAAVNLSQMYSLGRGRAWRMPHRWHHPRHHPHPSFLGLHTIT